VVAGAAAVRLVPEGRRDEGARRHFDVAGALTVTAGLVILVYAIVRTDVEGWGARVTLVEIGLGLALLAVFVLIEGRLSRRPLMPLRLFRSRTLTGANVVVFLLGSSVFAMWYFVSLYLQQVLGYTPIQAGLAFLPMTLSIIAGSTFAGRLVTRLGAGPLLTVGMALAGAGMLLFGRVSPHGTYVADVLAPSLLVAIGIGLAFVPVTIAAVAGVAREEAGLASGVINTSRQIGGSLGLAVLATLATERTAHLLATPGALAREALTAGYHRAFLVGAGFALAGSLAAALLVPRVRGARGPVPREAPAEAA
jgi:predicted MFS family arabinose efflux permease